LAVVRAADTIVPFAVARLEERYRGLLEVARAQGQAEVRDCLCMHRVLRS